MLPGSMERQRVPQGFGFGNLGLGVLGSWFAGDPTRRVYAWDYYDSGRSKLPRLPRRAHKIPQHCYVRSVRSDAAGIHRQAETLRLVEVHSRIIQLGQAVARRRQYSIHPRRIHGPRRPMALPWSLRQFVKLLPIAFVPRRHCYLLYVFFYRLDARGAHKVLGRFVSSLSSHVPPAVFLIPACCARLSGAKHTPQMPPATTFLFSCF